MLSQSSSDIVLLAEAIGMSSCILLPAIVAIMSGAGYIPASVLSLASEACAMPH